MQAKSFLFMSVVVVVAVAIISSLIGVMMFQKPVLLADEQGIIEVLGLTANVSNVFIVDSAFESKGISDTVTFTTVATGDTHYTVVDGTTLGMDVRCTANAGGNCPAPFMIVNDGNIVVDVEIERDSNLFDSSTESAGTSDLRIWIENPNPNDATLPYRTGWNSTKVDDCVANTCYTSTPCATIDLVPPSTMCSIPITTPTVVEQNLINDLKWEDDRDEAIMHVWITVASNEPSGTKSTTVTVTGIDAASF